MYRYISTCTDMYMCSCTLCIQVLHVHIHVHVQLYYSSLSLTKDMTGKEDQYRSSAIRALCVITDVRNIATMLISICNVYACVCVSVCLYVCLCVSVQIWSILTM